MRVSDSIIEIVQDLECLHQGTDISINGRALADALRDVAERARVEEGVMSSCRDALNGVCERLGLTGGDGLPDKPEVIWAELDRRLMPEGMEWPRFEDGDPVRIGDSAPFGTDGVMEVAGVEINRFGYVLHGSIDDGMRECVDGDDHGVAVKRPAPKVLDADGVEVDVGDDLYSVEGGLKLHVSHIDRINGKIATDAMFSLDKWADPAMFTHRAPVLAADGMPLREGETVYLTDSPTAFVVDDIMTREDGAIVVHLKNGAWHRPQDLTHDRPDSWKRLWMDMHPADETECVGLNFEEFERRATALAERGR